MIRMRINRILLMLIESAYLGVIFLVPLYFSIVPRTSNVFELNKVVLFRMLVLVLLLFGSIFIILQGNFKKNISSFLKTRGNLLIAPLVFLLSLLVITFFSDYRTSSFWGSYDYQLGFYSYFFIFLFFLLLIIFVKTQGQINRILGTIVFSSFFVCFYGFIQATGHDFLDWSELSQNRIFSTLGQPNYLASYLLLIMPISWHVFLKTKNIFFKYFVILVSFLQLFCLVFSYSRAGEIGLLLGVFIFLSTYLFADKKIILKFKKRTYFFIVLGIFSFFFLAWLNFPENQKLRIKSTFRFDQGSVASRVDFYQASWQGIKKKPFLGYGLENQKEVIIGGYQKDWAVFNNINTVPSQAHNVILDCLLTGGLFGLLMYLLFNFYFVRLAILNIKRGKGAGISSAILFAWVCYTISLLFGFVILVTEIYLWLFLAILSLASSSEFLDKNNQQFESEGLMRLLVKIFIILVISLGVFYSLNRELKLIIADHYFYKLESAIMNRSYFEAIVLFDWIKELKIGGNYYDLRFSNILADDIEKDTAEIWAESAKQMILPKTIGLLIGESYQEVCTRAKIYSVMASDDNHEYFAKSEKDFQECITRAKEVPENYREFAKHYYKKGDYEKALSNLGTSLSKIPDLSDTRINSDHREGIENELYLIDLQYGNIYLEKKDFSKAEYYFRLATAINDRDLSVQKKIIDTYYLRGDYSGAISLLEEMGTKDKINYYWPYLIAQIYLEKGEKSKATEYANKAFLLNSESEQVKLLFEELNNEKK